MLDEPRGEVVLLADGGDLSIVPMDENEFRLVITRGGVTFMCPLSSADVWGIRQATGGLVVGSFRSVA